MYRKFWTFTENKKKMKVNIRTMLSTIMPEKDKDHISWYAEPHAMYTIYDGDNPFKIHGTYHSTECSWFTTNDDNICAKCQHIPKLQSFRKRALLRNAKSSTNGTRNTSSIPNEHLKNHELLCKVKTQRAVLNLKNSELFFLKIRNLRLKI